MLPFSGRVPGRRRTRHDHRSRRSLRGQLARLHLDAGRGDAHDRRAGQDPGATWTRSASWTSPTSSHGARARPHQCLSCRTRRGRGLPRGTTRCATRRRSPTSRSACPGWARDERAGPAAPHGRGRPGGCSWTASLRRRADQAVPGPDRRRRRAASTPTSSSCRRGRRARGRGRQESARGPAGSGRPADGDQGQHGHRGRGHHVRLAHPAPLHAVYTATAVRGCSTSTSWCSARPTWTSSPWGRPPRTPPSGPTRNPWDLHACPAAPAAARPPPSPPAGALVAGLRHRRLHPPAGRPVRHRRHEADLRRGLAVRAGRLRVLAGPGRAACAHGRATARSCCAHRRPRPDATRPLRSAGPRSSCRRRTGSTGCVSACPRSTSATGVEPGVRAASTRRCGHRGAGRHGARR